MGDEKGGIKKRQGPQTTPAGTKNKDVLLVYGDGGGKMRRRRFRDRKAADRFLEERGLAGVRDKA